jgi:hypothetical protein
MCGTQAAVQAAPAIPCPEGHLRNPEACFRTERASYVQNSYTVTRCVRVPAATLMR